MIMLAGLVLLTPLFLKHRWTDARKAAKVGVSLPHMHYDK